MQSPNGEALCQPSLQKPLSAVAQNASKGWVSKRVHSKSEEQRDPAVTAAKQVPTVDGKLPTGEPFKAFLRITVAKEQGTEKKDQGKWSFCQLPTAN